MDTRTPSEALLTLMTPVVESKPVICRICGAHLSGKQAITPHYKIHHPKVVQLLKESGWSPFGGKYGGSYTNKEVLANIRDMILESSKHDRGQPVELPAAEPAIEQAAAPTKAAKAKPQYKVKKRQNSVVVLEVTEKPLERTISFCPFCGENLQAVNHALSVEAQLRS